MLASALLVGMLTTAPGACQGKNGVVNVNSQKPATHKSACLEKGTVAPFDGVLLSEQQLKDMYKSEKLARMMVDISVTATVAHWKSEVEHQKRLVLGEQDRRKADLKAAETRREKDAVAYDARIAASAPSGWTAPWVVSLATAAGIVAVVVVVDKLKGE